MSFNLPDLPYALDALQPHISKDTLNVHYNKHHQAYVTNLKHMILNTPLEGQTLEEVIEAARGNPDMVGIFNNAAQVWNHTFYWNSMKPNGGGRPTGKLADMINDAFGDFDAFEEAFKKAAVTQFGSGWAWLVFDAGQLKIVQTSNADVPLNKGQVPLLTCDVWEHAYYLDYQNRRPDYVEHFFSHLINWDFVNHNLDAALNNS